MVSAVFTLFEGDYHFGVGALTNSLYKHGFRGVIWAGFRGALPFWANNLVVEHRNYSELVVAEGLSIRFVQIDNHIHLAFQKPEFILQLAQSECAHIEKFFFFDADIVALYPWSFFEEWVTCGVSLCEDAASPIHHTHPKRAAWRSYFSSHGIELTNSLDYYVNSGFIGIERKHLNFLEQWKNIFQFVNKSLEERRHIFVGNDPWFKFWLPDQDALNIALMTTPVPISLANHYGMGFGSGHVPSIMSHAVGPLKPWRSGMLLGSLNNRFPAVPQADRTFLEYTLSPIRLYSPSRFRLKKIDCALSRLVYNLRSARC